MFVSVVRRFFFSVLLSLSGKTAFCLAIYIFSIFIFMFLVAHFSTFFIACSSLRTFFLSIFYAFCAATSAFLAAAYTFLILAAATFLAAIVVFFSATAANLAFFWAFFILTAIDLIGQLIGGMFKLLAKALSLFLDSDLKELPRKLANKLLYMTLSAIQNKKPIAASCFYLCLTWGVAHWGSRSLSVIILE